MAFLLPFALAVAGSAALTYIAVRPNPAAAYINDEDMRQSARYTGPGPLNPHLGQSPAPPPARPGTLNQTPPDTRFKPRAIDIIVVKGMLGKGLRLPPELVDMILDAAEYWACAVVSGTFKGTNAVRVRGGDRHGPPDMLILRTPPIGFPSAPVEMSAAACRFAEPRFTAHHTDIPSDKFKDKMKLAPSLDHPVRKIVFNMRSKDQGWGGAGEDRGTFRGSWSWFEAGLERLDREEELSKKASELDPHAFTTILPAVRKTIDNDGAIASVEYPLHPSDDLTIQCNRTAARGWADYQVVWRWTDRDEPDMTEEMRLQRFTDQGRGKFSGNGEFVRGLKVGDVVTLWGKARFGGWANNVESASIEVHWTL